MYWYEVLEAKKNRIVKITTFYFSNFSEESCIEYSEQMEKTIDELISLGHNLTIDDYDKVKSLSDKLDALGAMYRGMRYLDTPENQKLSHYDRFIGGTENAKNRFARKQKEIDEGIKNFESDDF
ncbi:MAG: hypothetical protein IPG89_18280 [Bacteroidetes bacterium]|nr:hypothetical protein [Bacteroidota bacterium]